MQKTIILSLALTFGYAGVFAQTTTASAAQVDNKGQVSPAEKAQKATEKIDGLAHLTAEQKGKVLPLMEEYYTNIQAIKKASADPKSAETHSKVQEQKQLLFSKLQGVLSASQLATVKETYNKEQSPK
jgi:hypothetical protein